MPGAASRSRGGSSRLLGLWYGTLLRRRPAVGLFVNSTQGSPGVCTLGGVWPLGGLLPGSVSAMRRRGDGPGTSLAGHRSPSRSRTGSADPCGVGDIVKVRVGCLPTDHPQGPRSSAGLRYPDNR